MRNKILTIALSSLLLVACETTDSQNVNVGQAAAPGTPEDFKQQIKDRVFFGYDKSNISDDAKKTLETQAGWLKTYANTNATIEGKTDVRGTREYNLALGERRANAAKKTLEGFGIDGARLKTLSLGKDQPEVVGNTEEAHAHNRTAVTNIN